MAASVRLPSGTVVHIDDLPIVLVEEAAISAGMPPAEWFNLAFAPAANPRGAVALLKVCAARVGEPEPPDDYVTVGNALTVFFTAPSDDRPTEYEDGVPKEVDAPETTT